MQSGNPFKSITPDQAGIAGWAEPLKQVSAWIEKSRAFWRARLDALDELLEAEDAAATQQPDKKGKPK